ncbi:hypothetical protein FOQG_09458 [Fusarium oxysporum f. sp. raphani 54005]|uniref:Uncharacterized protein n=3 Tax=Fusarium oxysporum TaxID=5507 RepID=X0C8S0_FUSOX|nr:hypothetical protein FOZG_09710 [Fusarium oxysporum Fo47]EWZ79350.1 hypothetical protein FOWG_16511 [Fusarium oxysporum f. sp. lycopersici MN25]EXK87209.1 hypothetical protein FOQG_09458 [Fusarium oxysporum f. sp. raphani 54005]EXL57342.1 hypothetical protein FOCG_04574 [Fusarium oxysporum f. sp. radicis-lycopersici 26381]EXM22734.1 hypothetical protein FOTG_09895 [Fusarium oxysporum f. sp. vasinfectum 25433]
MQYDAHDVMESLVHASMASAKKLEVLVMTGQFIDGSVYRYLVLLRCNTIAMSRNALVYCETPPST